MLYLHNAVLIDRDSFAQSSGDFAVEPGPDGALLRIASIPPASERGEGDSLIDCKGRFVMPSLVCGHHHIYSCLSRGMPPAPRAPQNFVDVLELVWWRLDKCLDKDMTEASALAAGLQMAKNGVTFCIDHHAAPNAVEGSLSVISRAFERLGIGHLLCYEISDRDGPEIAEKGLEEHRRYFSEGGQGHVGLHASFTVSDKTLAAAADLARSHDTGLHIHVAEAASDQEHCLATHGKSVVRRLKDFGVLDLPKSILGHCVHINDEDKRLLAASPCWVVQNSESNLNNNVGLGEYGYSPNVMLGTDGMHSDMIRSAQAAYFTGIGREGLSPGQTYARLRNAHRHAALFGPCGNAANNLIILDYDSPTPLTQNNALGHFFYGLQGRHAHTVISQGRVIVQDGRLVSGNEEDILSFAREQALRLWAKLQA